MYRIYTFCVVLFLMVTTGHIECMGKYQKKNPTLSLNIQKLNTNKDEEKIDKNKEEKKNTELNNSDISIITSVLKQKDLLNSIAMRAKDLNCAIKKLGTDYRGYSSNHVVIMHSFCIKNIWRCAVALIEILKKKQKVTKDDFINSYIKPLEKNNVTEWSAYAKEVLLGKMSPKHIGALYYIIFDILSKQLIEKNIANVSTLIEHFYSEVESLQESSEEIENACRTHCCMVRVSDTDTYKALVQSFGVKILGQKDFAGFTPLHYAVFYNNYSAVQFLLSHNSDLVNIPSYNGQLPLLLATDERMRALLIKKTHIDVRIEDKTPLMLAFERGDMAIAHLLLKYGASRNVHDSLGKMPYHYAKSVDAYALAINGFDIIAKDPSTGLTAKCTAVKTGTLNVLIDLLNKEKELKPTSHCVDNSDALKIAREKLKKAKRKLNKTSEDLYLAIIALLNKTQSSSLLSEKNIEQKKKVENAVIKLSISDMPVHSVIEPEEIIQSIELSRNQVKKQRKLRKQQEDDKKKEEEIAQKKAAKKQKRQSRKLQQEKAEKLLAIYTKMQKKLLQQGVDGWKMFVKNEKEVESQTLKQKNIANKKVVVQQDPDVLRFQRELAYDQNVQEIHGLGRTIAAHEWYIQHIDAQKSVSTLCTVCLGLGLVGVKIASQDQVLQKNNG